MLLPKPSEVPPASDTRPKGRSAGVVLFDAGPALKASRHVVIKFCMKQP